MKKLLIVGPSTEDPRSFHTFSTRERGPLVFERLTTVRIEH